MHRPRQCGGDNRIQLQNRQESNASTNFRRRPEQTVFLEQSNLGCNSGVNATIGESVQPELYHRRSPTDEDPDRQFDSEKGRVLPSRTEPDAVECARWEPSALVQIKNCRC